MKKLLLTCLFSTIISLLFGNYIFTSYKTATERIIATSTQSEKVYMLLYGSYNSKEKVDKITIDNYILEEDNGFYKVYIGVSLSLENAKKIKEIYNNLGNSIYIREKYINDFEFIYYLESVDKFDNLSNDEILNIEDDIIDKYKEIFNE